MNKLKLNIDTESLEEEIAYFNDWTKSARLCYNKEDGYFVTDVYINDSQMENSLLADGYIAVFSKSEYDGSLKIGEKRKEYIFEYLKLISDGWTPLQADNKLSDKYY